MATVEVSRDTELFESVELYSEYGLEILGHIMRTLGNRLHYHC